MFTGVEMFSCEFINGGFHGELMVGECGTSNCSGIVRESGCVIGWLRGFQRG